MSVRVRVSLAAPLRARLRRAAGGFLFVSAMTGLAGCTVGSVLAPVPPVDIGTHTAAIAGPRPVALMTPAAAAELPAASSSGPAMVWQTGPSGIGADDNPDASWAPEAPVIAAAPLDPAPPVQPNYDVPIPVPPPAAAVPAVRRPAPRAEGPRYAMLPPAAPGDLRPPPSFTPPPPEPEEMPEAPPPPAARDFSRPADVMPADEIARRRELKRLGVRYEDLPPIHERGVCGIDYPVKVTGLSGGIEVKPAAVLNTTLAVTFARYVHDDFAPAVRTRYFSGIRTIYTGSTYACRNMIGESSHHLSEHAKGNAIDVMKIKLDSGRLIDVTKPGFFAFRQRGFLKKVRGEACGYFTTVLGPGYNRAHANHFHFDLMKRKNGYVACR